MNEDQHESPPANAMDQALMDYLDDILGAPDRGKPRPAIAKPQNVTPLEVVKPRPTSADVTPLPLKTESRQPAARPFLQEEKPKTLSTLNLLNLRPPPPEPPKPVLVPVEKPVPVEAKKPAPPVAPPAEPVIAPAKPAAPPAPVAPDPVAVEAGDEEDARLPAVEPARQPSPRPEWAEQRFECLIFNVAGLKLAVPLITLGAIHRIDRKLNALPHQSDWFIGILQTHAAGNIKVLDTALCVMPERYDPASRDNLAYVLTIHGYAWGLACHGVEKSITLEPHQVKWRTERGKRPWLAGTVIDYMCALIDTEGFSDVIRKAEQQT